MLDLHFPHLSFTPIFPSLFSVEQTETELPLLEQLLPACCIVARSCADLCRWVIVLPLFFFFSPFFLSSDGGDAGEDLRMWNTDRNKEQVRPCELVLIRAYVFYVQVCVVAYASMLACLFMPEDGSEWSGGGDRRCTCCHRAVNSLAEFSWIIALLPAGASRFKALTRWNKTMICGGLVRNAAAQLSLGLRWHGNSRAAQQEQTFPSPYTSRPNHVRKRQRGPWNKKKPGLESEPSECSLRWQQLSGST